MKRNTVEMLLEKQACAEQVRKFKRLFPTGAPVSMRSAEKVMKAGLDLTWCVILLPKPLDDQYLAASKPLYDQYWAARKPLYDQYEAARATLLVSQLLKA